MNYDVESSPTSNRFDALKPSALNRAEKDAVIRLALSVLAERHRAGRALSNPDQTRAFLQLTLGERKNEVFGALFLDNRHRVLQVAELFQGTINSATIHPRVVVQRALEINAAALVLFHNHPSGVAEPSQADRALTRQLWDALALVDVRVIDHFVIGAEESLSFAERGLI